MNRKAEEKVREESIIDMQGMSPWEKLRYIFLLIAVLFVCSVAAAAFLWEGFGDFLLWFVS